MRKWVVVALLAVPLLDIVLLVWIAGVIGAVGTVALVVLTGLIGVLLVRAEGRHTLREIHRKLARGTLPTNELLDGGLLLLAGALLLTPGIVTDVIGLVLVLPPTRYPIRSAVKKWIVVPAIDRETGGFMTGNVYIGGFPEDPETGSVYDLNDDAYSIDIDGDRDGDSGKRNP